MMTREELAVICQREADRSFILADVERREMERLQAWSTTRYGGYRGDAQRAGWRVDLHMRDVAFYSALARALMGVD